MKNHGLHHDNYSFWAKITPKASGPTCDPMVKPICNISSSITLFPRLIPVYYFILLMSGIIIPPSVFPAVITNSIIIVSILIMPEMAK